MGLTEFLAEHITRFIELAGYPGVTLLMMMESMVFPVPSEAVMPFAGFLIAQGKFTWLGVILASTVGSLIGSVLSYWIGRYGGNPFLKRYGRYFLLNETHLLKTEQFFKHYGEPTIFISRFIPIVRHLISLPAGLSRMKGWKFCLYTVLGAGLWNTFLAWVGYKLMQNWNTVIQYSETIDLGVLAVIGIGGGWVIYQHVKNKKARGKGKFL